MGRRPGTLYLWRLAFKKPATLLIVGRCRYDTLQGFPMSKSIGLSTLYFVLRRCEHNAYLFRIGTTLSAFTLRHLPRESRRKCMDMGNAAAIPLSTALRQWKCDLNNMA